MKKKAVITGGAGDIGKVICSHFLAKGFKVVIVDVRKNALKDFSKQLLKEKIDKKDFSTVCVDLTDMQQIEKNLASLSIENTSVLVHCVGYANAETIGELNEDLWRKDISLNLDSAYYISSVFLDAMKKKKEGSLVFIGSVNADSTYGSPSYSAAKAALVSFVKAIALEYGPFGIRANMVSPASVLTRAWVKRLKINPQVFEKLKEWYPLKRIPTPESIAKAVYFLASESADCISGVNLRVDCGLSSGNAHFAQTITQKKFL